MTIVDFRVGDVVELRKPHPCGGSRWTVYRVGADIRLLCETCAHRVMLERRVMEKRLKRFVSRADEVEAGPAAAGDGEAGPAAAGDAAGAPSRAAADSDGSDGDSDGGSDDG